jgi:hypothetical protein
MQRWRSSERFGSYTNVRYESPAALRQALEARLRHAARVHGVDLERLRRRAAYTRLLVRLASSEPGQWILKGGMGSRCGWVIARA